jgi:hypothetical protein
MILICVGFGQENSQEEKGMAVHISTDAQKDLRELVTGWCKNLPSVGSVNEAEELAFEVRRIVGELVFELGLLDITGKASYRGTTLPCTCGSTKRFVDYRKRWVKSMCGETQVERAYYHCPGKKHSEGVKQDPPPWDQEQGLTSLIGTPRFKGTVCRVMGVVPYSNGVGLVSELCDVKIEESTAEGIMLEVGPRIRAVEEKRVEQVKLHIERATQERLMADAPERAPLAPLETRPVVGETIYFGVDAATAHIGGGWHNVQHGVVFTVKKDKDGNDTLLQREYTAGQMDMETLGWRMRALSEIWQGRAYKKRVFLGDGAPCNWTIASEYFPDAMMILDFWHASEHLGELCKKLYRQDDEKQKALGKRWLADRLHSLKRDGPKPLLRALKRRSCAAAEQREAVRKELHYFKANQARMDYPAHTAAGRMIGSGPIEAACKSITGGRLKGTGMRWSVDGADAVLAVRTTILNGDSGRLVDFAKAA